MPRSAVIVVNAYAAELYTRQVFRIRDALNARGIKAEAVRNGFFPLGVDGNAVDSALASRYDFCVYLDKDKYVAAMLEKRGMRLFNRAASIELCDDKMLTHIALSGGGIPMPYTVPGLLCYSPNSPVSKSYLDYVEEKLGYPVIVKRSYGSMGGGVFKADDRTELESLAEQVKLEPHLFQKYVKESAGRDMRVIVIGGEAIGGIIRRSNGDFRSNIGLGGNAEKCDVPREIAELAVKTAKILNLDYCGIDFLLSQEPLVCEVNSNAFFDAFESATGIDVAGRYAAHMISCI